jgi:hypothetical protein
MNEQEILEEITRLYSSEECFLVKLRVSLEFDEENYNQCCTALEKYVQLKRGEKFIHKEVAFFVYLTMSEMENRLHDFRKRNRPTTNKLIFALNEFAELTDRLWNVYPYP